MAKRTKASKGITWVNGVAFGRVQWKGKRPTRSLQQLFPDRQITNKTEAESAYQDFKKLVQTGKLDSIIPVSGLTLGDFLLDYRTHYCEKKQNGKPLPMIVMDGDRCIRGQSDYARIEVIRRGTLAKENLIALSTAPTTIRDWIDELQEEREFGDNTRDHYQAILQGAFQYAIDCGPLAYGIEGNPFAASKILYFTTHAPRTRRVSVVEVALLLQHAKDPILAARIQAAVTLGLRRGELLGSQIKHYNFHEWTLTLPRIMVKTDRSARVVPIKDQATRDFLNTRRFLGANSHPFGHFDGTFMPHFNPAWQALLREAFEVEDHTDESVNLRFHDLRAECCSRMLENTQDIVIVADILGDSIATVEKHYKRLLSLDKKRAAMA